MPRFFKVQSAEFRVQSAVFVRTILFLCHPVARDPRKNECFCGVHFDHGMTREEVSSPRMTRWRKTRPRMTKRIQDSKNPHMIIFSLQDMWQTNKINTKHVPNPNRLD